MSSVISSRRHLFVSIYSSPRLPSQNQVYLYEGVNRLKLRKVSYLNLQEIHRIPTDMITSYKTEFSTAIPRLNLRSLCMLAERLDLFVEVSTEFLHSALTAMNVEREPQSQSQSFLPCLNPQERLIMLRIRTIVMISTNTRSIRQNMRSAIIIEVFIVETSFRSIKFNWRITETNNSQAPALN